MLVPLYIHILETVHILRILNFVFGGALSYLKTQFGETVMSGCSPSQTATVLWSSAVFS